LIEENTGQYYAIKNFSYIAINNIYNVINIDKFEKLIPNHNIISHYHNVLLILKYSHYKYYICYSLISLMNIIITQLLIKITLLILNNLLVWYGTYDNVIKSIKLNIILNCIKNNTNILEELIRQTMKICINTVQCRKYQDEKQKSLSNHEANG